MPAKSSSSDCCKIFKKDSIDKIEVIILIVANLGHGILADNHQILQIFVVEATNHFFNVHLFLVTSVLPLPQLLFWVHLVKIEFVVEHKKASFTANEETEVFF